MRGSLSRARWMAALPCAALLATLPTASATPFNALDSAGAEGKILATWTDESDYSCTNLTLSDPDGTVDDEAYLDWGCNDGGLGWTPDGRHLAGITRNAIILREVDGPIVERVDRPQNAYVADRALSPDGQNVYFLNTSLWWPPQDTSAPDLQILNLATGRVRRFEFPGVRYIYSGEWSTDGGRLFLHSFSRIGPWRDFVFDVERGRLRELDGGAWDLGGFHDVAPDGRRGLFLRRSRRAADPMMISARLDGSDPVRLGRGYGDWSPRGDLIAFTREQDSGVDAIYVMPATGGTPKRIATPFSGVLDMVWSPEGDRIAYASPHPDPEIYYEWEIRVVNVDGTGDHQVGDDFADLGWGELDWQSLCAVIATEGTSTSGTAGPDKICGTSGTDAILAGLGSDTVFGYAGEDELLGEGGNDLIVSTGGPSILRGGAGRDRLLSYGGVSRLSGGDGNDRLDARDGRGGDVLIGGPGRDACLGDPGDVKRSC